MAQLQTGRRSVRSTVVGAVWLGELLPHGFSKKVMVKTTPGSHTITPTRDSYTRSRDKTDRPTSSFGDEQENDTHLKRRRVTDRVTDESHTHFRTV